MTCHLIPGGVVCTEPGIPPMPTRNRERIRRRIDRLREDGRRLTEVYPPGKTLRRLQRAGLAYPSWAEEHAPRDRDGLPTWAAFSEIMSIYDCIDVPFTEDGEVAL